jgi:hypothetical protein
MPSTYSYFDRRVGGVRLGDALPAERPSRTARDITALPDHIRVAVADLPVATAREEDFDSITL